MAQKPIKGVKLVVRATLIGHVSKEIWVAKAIAGGELFVGSKPLKSMLEVLILVIISMLTGGAIVQKSGMKGLFIATGGIIAYTVLWVVTH